jgi:hypothetical protein
VLRFLQTPRGASLQELTKLTGWQPHTVRGFLSGTIRKKNGLRVTLEKRQNGPSVYRVESAP